MSNSTVHCVGDQHELTLRFLAEPTEVNFGGKVHGGSVMKWIDHAGYACATAWSGMYCVTAYVGGIRFVSPIHVGELVEARAKVLHTARTSMHIAVDVYARDPRAKTLRKCTHCMMVFVGVDTQGQPQAVPVFTPLTPEQIALETYAKRLIDLRKNIEAEMGPHLS
jgi:uncharacterized protein (TIGR00369 family)